MKLVHLSYNRFMISDADAERLVKGANKTPLPRIGYEAKVMLPNGKKAWLTRDYSYSHNKRGWIWALYSNDRIVSDDERTRYERYMARFTRSKGDLL
jgi:hypothetical protein